MKNVIKWIVIVMLVSIDILTPFGNAELYSETDVENVETDVEEVMGSDDIVESQEDGDFSLNEEEVDSQQLQEEQQDTEEIIELDVEDTVLENGEQGEIVEENKAEEEKVEEIIDLQETIPEDSESVEEEVDEIIEEDKGKAFPKIMVDKGELVDRMTMAVNVYGCVKYQENTDETINIIGLNTEQEGCNVDLIIPNEIDGKQVTEVGYRAFADMKKLEGELVIPDTVMKIGGQAFYKAFNLNTQNYLVFEGGGNNLETIGDSAFYDNAFLGLLKLPSGLSGTLNQFGGNKFTGIDFNGANITEIGRNFMKERYSLQGTLTIPSTVKKINDSAFYRAFNQNTENYLVFENGGNQIEAIGPSAFSDNNLRGVLEIPSGLSGVLDQFSWNKFTGIDFNGANITEIGRNFMKERYSLQGTLTIPSTVKKINDSAFYRAFSGKTENYLVFENGGNQIEAIGPSAFSDNNLRGILEIPSGLSGVLNQFSWNKFTGIDFNGANITEIGGYFMRERYSLQGTLTIPSTVKKINDYAFDRAFSGKTENYLVFENEGIQVETIGTSAFYGNNLIGVLKLPRGLSGLLSAQFRGNKFTGLDFNGANITEIGNDVFYEMRTLEGELVIPDTVEKIGDDAFGRAFNTSTVNTLKLGTGLKVLVSRCFRDDNFTGNLVLPEGLTTIGYSTFASNKFNGELVLPEGLTILTNSVFYGNKFTKINFNGANITEIGSDVFYEMRTLEGELVIPDTVEKIGDDAFGRAFNTSTVNTLKLGTGLKELVSRCFRENNIKGELILPGSLTKIGYSTFSSNKFTKVLFATGSNVTIDNGNAFCTNASNPLKGYPNGSTVTVTTPNSSCFFLVQMVKLDPNNGDPIETLEVNYNDKVQLLHNPEKSGYTFIGWYKSGTDLEFDLNTPVTTDLELVAMYEGEKNVIIDVNELGYGIVSSGFIVSDYGLPIIMSGNRILIGDKQITSSPTASDDHYTYKFSGWTTTCDKTIKPVCNDDIIYAHTGEYVFNGTNYIRMSTGFFSEGNYQRDFEVSFNIVSYNPGTEKQGAFINAMNESGSPWPGIVFRRADNNANVFELVSNGGVGTSTHSYNKSDIQRVKISRKNMKLYIQINNGAEQEVYDYTDFNSYFNVPVTIGSSLNGSGQPFRYVKATLSDIFVKFMDDKRDCIGTTVLYDSTYENIGKVTSDCRITANFDRTVNKYEIKFVDEDGSELQSSQIEYGEIPSYEGSKPEKTGDIQYSYVFTGWIPGIFPVTGNMTYTAKYEQVVNKYLIRFVNEDGTELQSSEFEYGSVPEYYGDTPKKESTPQYSYIFKDWGEEIVSVTGPKVYTATYTESVNKYMIKFVNENGLELQSSELEYGAMPEYSGETPVKNPTVQYTYRFDKWLPDIKKVETGAIYVAIYTGILNKYTVTWIDGDGNIIGSGKYEYGTLPVYSGIAPTKSSDTGFNYIFNGQWLPEIQVVTGDVQYVAQFNQEVIESDSGRWSGAGGKKRTDLDVHGSAEEKTEINSDGDIIKQKSNTISTNSSVGDSEGQIIKTIVKNTEIVATVKNTVHSNSSSYTKEQNDAYSFAKSNGITTTQSIEDAKMNTELTRIQMAKMLSNFAINVLGQEPDPEKGMVNFDDVTNKMDKQYDNAVTKAYQLGIMGQNVKNNEFRPNDTVTRAEFATSLSRLLYDTEEGEYKGTGKYYVPHIAKLYNEGIINKADPNIKEKRGYVMTMLKRTIE